ncbi:MAG: uracil-DNA glycosylase [Planctomycetota bacterium]
MIDDARRLLAQHARTASLLGVDFLPIGECRDPMPVQDVSAQKSADVVMVREDPPAQPTSLAGAMFTGSIDVPREGSHAERLERLRAMHEADSPILTMIDGWTNIVFGDGDPDADLMFVGEAPGADEDAQGLPFVGRAGQLLNKMIVAMGLSRSQVYIANVLKVRPPGNRTPTPREWEADGPYLKAQIEIIQPKAIVTLGKPAAHYLLQSDQAMGRLRGAWHEYASFPVMPTYHPAYLLRSYTDDNRRKVWSDLQMVMSRLGEGS